MLVLAFNPTYNSVPTIIKNSEGRTEGCGKCSINGRFCPFVLRDFFESIMDEISVDGVLLNDKFWLENYGKAEIEFIMKWCSDHGVKIFFDDTSFYFGIIDRLQCGAAILKKDYREIYKAVNWALKL